MYLEYEEHEELKNIILNNRVYIIKEDNISIKHECRA
jgi:hypothetical protein